MLYTVYMYTGIIFASLILLLPILIVGLIIWAIIWIANKNKSGENTNVAEHKPQALDIVYYIAMFAALTSSVTSIISIVFTAIDHRYRDVLEISNNYYNEIQAGNDVRLSVAILLVVFPLYLVVSWVQARRIKLDITRNDLTIRKVYSYGIIFITVLTLVGSLIYVIYNFLSGEIFLRFGPKALALALITGSICAYHIYTLRRDYSQNSKIPLYLTVLSALMVFGVIVFSIIETGTPSQIRKLKLDDQRITDLSEIQNQILNAWMKKGVLPASLQELQNEISGYSLKVDPSTKAPYEYNVLQQSVVETEQQVGGMTSTKLVAKSEAIFTLCANFEAVRDIAKYTNQSNSAYGSPAVPTKDGGLNSYDLYQYSGADYTNPYWDHGAERTCFTRHILPNQYQITNTY